MAEENLNPVAGTQFYPKYHLAAPIGWINDPNGFCYYNGEYHMFYQYHPHSPFWGPMHWGHATSKDLITWENQPIAIAPDRDYDRDGCFSGSAIEKDGKLYLMYTGHVNVDDYHREKQCLAISEDGIHFEKYEGNPILEPPQLEEISQCDFRDPKVWKHNQSYYCVIGSKTADEFGQTLLYQSTDLINWEFQGVMARSKDPAGKMWECPNLAEFKDGAILIMSVIGGPESPMPYQTGYLKGKFNYKTMKFIGDEFKLLDYGPDFYAPQITRSPIDGRVIMMGWLSTWNVEMPEQRDGWAGLMTVPRQIIYKDGKITTPPVKELENLRSKGFSQNNLSLTEAKELKGIVGDVGELIVEVDLKNNPEFSIELRKDEEEKTVLNYSSATKILSLDRNQSGEGPKDIHEVELEKSGKLNLRIFLDKSSIEVFANDGEAVISARIYPRETSKNISFVPRENDLRIISATFYPY